MSGFRFLRFAAEDGVARLTLARPPLNILTVEAMREINAALDRTAADPALKALLLAGEGRAFSAGVAVEDHLGARAGPMLEEFHGIFRRLHALECVTVASVHGAALGGGAELATFCDLVIASEDATLGQPEITVGVFPPIAALHYPRRVGPARALTLLLSGRAIGAAEAERIGLVDCVVPRDRLPETVELHVARLRAHSGAILRLTKRAVRVADGVDFDEALATLEEIYRSQLMVTEDATEGLRAFVEKRTPVWKDR